MPPYRALVTRSGEDRGKPYFLKNASRLQPGTGKGPQRHCQPKQLRNNPRGCFNAPKFPQPPTTHPSSPTPIGDFSDILQTVIPGENRNIPPPSFRRRPESGGAGGLPSVPHEVEPATSHNRHPRQKPEPTKPSFRRRPEPRCVGGPLRHTRRSRTTPDTHRRPLQYSATHQTVFPAQAGTQVCRGAPPPSHTK